jgi:hypothetical protein
MDDNYWRYPFGITVEERNAPVLKGYFETFRYLYNNWTCPWRDYLNVASTEQLRRISKETFR